jgi:ATP-dependent Clp protease ATP-binding subunit ClpC
VQIQPEALEAAVRFSSRYMLDRRQPDKALDLLDEACARLVIQTADEPALPRIVTAETIAEVLAEWTGIPLAQLTENERRKYQRIEEALKNRIVGQDPAVAAVADAIKTNRAGLSDPRRPMGVFLFLGPSGVGKTELAKALAEFLFGSENALLRLDMSEFHDEHTVARLIGSPPGYKDSQRGGQLTEALRRKPHAVVLLDEVDKAAPEVFDLFLQVFDDGRLTDARGATVDARHAVWIMTSNIGTSEGSKGTLGFRSEAFGTQNYQAALRRFFRLEFLNRLDDVIIFNALTQETLVAILELQLRDLRARLSGQGLKLHLEPSARELILSQGYDPANGARPLRRAIERLLIRPLSQRILDNLYLPGQTITASVDEDGRLAFGTAQPTAASEA